MRQIMTITLLSDKDFDASARGYHVLTYAEEGFAPLNIHGQPHGLSASLLRAFADEVNRKGESGSLHPRAPISAVPRTLIRDRPDHSALSARIKDFLRANRQTIQAKRVLCDFRTPQVKPYVVSAIAEAMRSAEAQDIEEVIILSPEA
jgi:hypothetical protein